jgi:hypothetical protein
MKVWNKEQYWEAQEKKRGEDGRLPRGSFDFISIHSPCILDKDTPYEKKIGRYSLLAPLYLCDNVNRPSWEEACFRTKKDAEIFAKEIAKQHGLKVVFCD